MAAFLIFFANKFFVVCCMLTTGFFRVFCVSDFFLLIAGSDFRWVLFSGECRAFVRAIVVRGEYQRLLAAKSERD